MGAETLNFDDFPDAVDFMEVQAGHVSHAIDEGNWCETYRAALDKEFAEILHHLHDRGPLLDIGGGMGAIDAMLYVAGAASTITIMDGIDDRPEVISHDEPFSNAVVARAFLTGNGVPSDDLYMVDARKPGKWPFKGRKFKTVISLRSWCFHYAPETYAPMVFDHCLSGTVIIVDVRKGREWASPLNRWFGEPKAVIRDEPKYQRQVFHV